MRQEHTGRGKLRRTIRLVKFLESTIRNTGWFVLIHDGTKQQVNRDQVQITDPTLYTRLYRMKLDGEFVNTWVRFIYNHRDNWADFEIRYRNSADMRATARELSGRKIVRAMQASEESSEDSGEATVNSTVHW